MALVTTTMAVGREPFRRRMMHGLHTPAMAQEPGGLWDLTRSSLISDVGPKLGSTRMQVWPESHKESTTFQTPSELGSVRIHMYGYIPRKTHQGDTAESCSEGASHTGGLQEDSRDFGRSPRKDSRQQRRAL